MACASSAVKAAMETGVCKAVLMLPLFPVSRLFCRSRRLPNQHRRLDGFRELAEVIGVITFDGRARLRHSLPNGLHGPVVRSIGHTGVERGTALGLRCDGQGPIQEFQTLLHADEAKPRVRPG